MFISLIKHGQIRLFSFELQSFNTANVCQLSTIVTQWFFSFYNFFILCAHNKICIENYPGNNHGNFYANFQISCNKYLVKCANYYTKYLAQLVTWKTFRKFQNLVKMFYCKLPWPLWEILIILYYNVYTLSPKSVQQPINFDSIFHHTHIC